MFVQMIMFMYHIFPSVPYLKRWRNIGHSHPQSVLFNKTEKKVVLYLENIALTISYFTKKRSYKWLWACIPLKIVFMFSRSSPNRLRISRMMELNCSKLQHLMIVCSYWFILGQMVENHAHIWCGSLHQRLGTVLKAWAFPTFTYFEVFRV